MFTNDDHIICLKIRVSLNKIRFLIYRDMHGGKQGLLSPVVGATTAFAEGITLKVLGCDIFCFRKWLRTEETTSNACSRYNVPHVSSVSPRARYHYACPFFASATWWWWWITIDCWGRRDSINCVAARITREQQPLTKGSIPEQSGRQDGIERSNRRNHLHSTAKVVCRRRSHQTSRKWLSIWFWIYLRQRIQEWRQGQCQKTRKIILFWKNLRLPFWLERSYTVGDTRKDIIGGWEAVHMYPDTQLDIASTLTSTRCALQNCRLLICVPPFAFRNVSKQLLRGTET